MGVERRGRFTNLLERRLTESALSVLGARESARIGRLYIRYACRLPIRDHDPKESLPEVLYTLKRRCTKRFTRLQASMECLGVYRQKRFDYLVREYVEHYHAERPHQGLENRLITSGPPPTLLDFEPDIQCRSRLGGLLKHYYRMAA